MTNITEILGKYGIELPDDKKDEFNKDFTTNYKTVAEFGNLQTRYNDDIKARDTDLTNLKAELDKASKGGEELDGLKAQLSGLQNKYDTEKQAYESKLQAQAYDFVVERFADSLEFTSNGAKKAFVADLKAKQLPLNETKDGLMGTDDFVKAYKEADSGAFANDNLPNFSTTTKKQDKTDKEWKAPMIL